MDRHALIVLAALLWAIWLVAVAGSMSSGGGTDRFGRPTTPPTRAHPFWNFAMALLFVLAVGLTAWLAS